MNKYTARKNYFKALAISHAIIQHEATITEEGETRARVSFIQVAAEQDSLSANMINGLDLPVLVQMGFSGGLADRDGDIRNRYQNRIQILDKAVVSDTYPTIEEATDQVYAKTYDILKQILSKMYHDMEYGCPAPFKLDFNGFAWNMVGPILDNFYGWELSFSDDEHANDILNFNAENWQ